MDEELRFVYKHYRMISNDPFQNTGARKSFTNAEAKHIYEGTTPQKLFTDAVHAYRVYHYTRGESKWEPTHYGGLTICYIYSGDHLVALGEAQCSTKDQFCYKIGRAIAKGRALKELSKEKHT